MANLEIEELRYLDLTLAAYVGEVVTIRYDPRDLAEVRVYHQDRFLCRAVCSKLTGATIALKDLVRARDARRRDLPAGIGERAKLLELLLGVHADVPPPSLPPAEPAPLTPRMKRYHNQ